MNTVSRPAGQFRPAEGEELVSEPQAGHGRRAAGDHQDHKDSLVVGGDPQSNLALAVLTQDHPPAEPGVDSLTLPLLHQVLITLSSVSPLTLAAAQLSPLC